MELDYEVHTAHESRQPHEIDYDGSRVTVEVPVTVVELIPAGGDHGSLTLRFPPSVDCSALVAGAKVKLSLEAE